MANSTPERFGTIFVGAGPGGTGPIVAAVKQNQLTELLNSPIAVVDRGHAFGAGAIGRYVIKSDTVGGTLLECMDGHTDDVYASVVAGGPAQTIAAGRTGAVPLQVVGQYMGELGQSIRALIDAHEQSQYLPGVEARQLTRTTDGWQTEVSSLGDTSGARRILVSKNVVLGLGGSQNRERTLRAELASGLSVGPKFAHKALLTDHVLTEPGVAELRRRLSRAATRRVVIIGSSHSAFSSAWVLLNQVGLEFKAEEIVMLYRQRPKVFYPTPAEAHADGYFDFDDNDLCTLTGRVYRLAGLRLDSRELLRRILGLGGLPPERRVRLQDLASLTSDELHALLDQAEVIIPAFGYRPNTLPVFDLTGERVPLQADLGDTAPLVNDDCQVLDAEGRPLPGLFGIGLATGFRPSGALGGEPSFTGQTNGIWLYQHGIGERILRQIV